MEEEEEEGFCKASAVNEKNPERDRATPAVPGVRQLPILVGLCASAIAVVGDAEIIGRTRTRKCTKKAWLRPKKT